MRAAPLLGLLLLAAAPALAHPESEAPALRPDVARVWHDPEVPPPHTQWQGFLALRPESNVTEAHYQVCRVGQACFAPPTPAGDAGNGTFRFDTTDYLANGRPVDYQPAWRLGVKWFLDGDEFPHGPDLASPACAGDAAMACAEQHYFVFTMGGDAAKPSPGVGLAVLFAAVAFAFVLRLRRA